MNDPLLDAILAVPLAPDTPPRASNPADFTSKLEIDGNNLTIELTEEGANEGTALRFLQDEGLTPADWEATHFKKIEYGAGLTSVKFSYKRVGFGADVNIDELVEHIKTRSRLATATDIRFTPKGALVALGDMQFGKVDGDGVEGTVKRVIEYLDKAADKILYSPSEISHIHIAWLGDHIEGYVSQGGANAVRTRLTLNEQIRMTRWVMTYAAERFAPLTPRLTMAAVPGNHGEPQRFMGKGITRYDDSHDTEALVCVSEALGFNPEAFGHVECFVPGSDELTVVLDVAGTKVAHVHGHAWTAGKHMDWWRGQAFHSPGLGQADLLLAGHLHHLLVEEDGKRTFVQVPALEAESTWWRHKKGSTGNPGLVLAYTHDGQIDSLEVVR